MKGSLCYLNKAADQGLAEAQYILARRYERQRDLTKGLEYCILAANQEHPAALYMLGRFYQFGHEIQPDHAKAFDLYARAAELGDPTANYQAAAGRTQRKRRDISRVSRTLVRPIWP
jgi:TPR repeat protein